MRWEAVAGVTMATVVVATVASVVPQCLSDSGNSRGVNTDLSGINDFSFDLYRQLSRNTPAENLFFSPYSIWTALTLIYFGTAGSTKTQLEAALRVTDKASTLRLWRALDVMYAQRASSQPQYTFNIANRAYFDDLLDLRPCISTILHKELQKIDFSDLYGSSATINEFVSTTTKGLIPNLVSPDDMVDAIMMLINAAYFKGTWRYQFKPSHTQPRQFFVSPGHSVDVAMMRIKTKLRLAHSEELAAQVLEVPYAGDAISMLLLLPDVEGEEGFRRVVSALTSGTLLRATQERAHTDTVELFLPKFKLEQMLEDDLKEGLKNLGIRDLFNGSLADLSQFSVNKELVVSKTIHKAFVEVNEEGTEAAASTAVVAVVRSGFNRAHSFVCNRPFLFLIHDNQTKNVLFMGAYKKPLTGSYRKTQTAYRRGSGKNK
ncbi:leukocyte elastase inhibitor-like [Procambarus clarkii]|uniref:leukocyte elastase inhibitor-like n=1 Tax=Procambarus clarkii TaxID=6728 RepID=UPI00374478C8